MIVKKKLCCACDTLQFIWKNHDGNKYCKHCWYNNTPPKPPKPISDKRRVEHVLYSKLRKEFLNKPENSFCKGRFPGVCLNVTGENLTIHHKKGRGKYYLDQTTWVSLCLACHTYVETHPLEARSLGLSDTKLL